MDTIVGFLVWGGLIWAVLTMLSSRGRHRGEAHPQAQEPCASGAAAPSPRDPLPGPGLALAETPGEAEALADGLVIGHFMTRHYYESRIEQLEQGLDDVDPLADDWLVPGGDSDGAGFDDGVCFDEFDALAGHSVEPWYDELLDLDHGED